MGVCGGAAPSIVILGPPHVWETIRARKLKFYIHLGGAKYSFRVQKLGPLISRKLLCTCKLKSYMHLDGSSTLFKYENFSAKGGEGRSLPNVNFGPPHISETTRARKFKLYMHLDGHVLVPSG